MNDDEDAHPHLAVLRLPGFWENWNLEMLVLGKEGKTDVPKEKPLGARIEPTINSIN